MEIKDTMENGTLTLQIIGRLDTNTAPLLETALQELDPETSVVLDLSEMEYVSSAGLRVFLMAKLRFKDHLQYVNLRENVSIVMSMTGFLKTLGIQ